MTTGTCHACKKVRDLTRTMTHNGVTVGRCSGCDYGMAQLVATSRAIGQADVKRMQRAIDRGGKATAATKRIAAMGDA